MAAGIRVHSAGQLETCTAFKRKRVPHTRWQRTVRYCSRAFRYISALARAIHQGVQYCARADFVGGQWRIPLKSPIIKTRGRLTRGRGVRGSKGSLGDPEKHTLSLQQAVSGFAYSTSSIRLSPATLRCSRSESSERMSSTGAQTTTQMTIRSFALARPRSGSGSRSTIKPRDEESVRISVPSGSFRAIFEWADTNPAQLPSVSPHEPERSQSLIEPITPPTSQEVAASSPAQTTSRFRGLRWWILATAALVILIFAILHYYASPEERAFNQFWSPVLDNSHTVLIYIGSNAVYELSSSYMDAYYQQHPRSQTEKMGLESYIPLPPGTKIDAQDLYPAKDTFVTIGDVAATTKVVSLLVHRNKQFDVRFGNRCGVWRPSRTPHDPDWCA